MRTKFICGNWKMNKSSRDAVSFIDEFIPLARDVKEREIAIAAPFIILSMLKERLRHTNIKLAAQNLFYEEQGAYTGEISASMLIGLVDYVILGHSERRYIFNETDEIVNKKIKAALKKNIGVIFCIGEILEDREKGKLKHVVERQLKKGLTGIDSLSKIIIAYEPVWAIGTGKNASPEQAEEAHLSVRRTITEIYGKITAEKTRIIYGGSVTSENASSLLKMPGVDGLLVGGASLDAKKFASIIKA